MRLDHPCTPGSILRLIFTQVIKGLSRDPEPFPGSDRHCELSALCSEWVTRQQGCNTVATDRRLRSTLSDPTDSASAPRQPGDLFPLASRARVLQPAAASSHLAFGRGNWPSRTSQGTECSSRVIRRTPLLLPHMRCFPSFGETQPRRYGARRGMRDTEY